MATIWLKRRGWEDGEVPDVCAKCGEHAPDRVEKTFSWVPSWVYLLILVHLLVMLVVVFVVRQRRRALVPLCDAHKNHWRWRNLLTLWSFVALVLGALVSLGVVLALADPDELSDTLAAWAVIVLLFGFIAWVIAMAVVHSGAIRALEFSRRGIRLTNVSVKFRDAYEEVLDREEEERYGGNRIDLDRSVRERWNEQRRRPQPRSGDQQEQVRKEEEDELPPPKRDRYRRE
jgi:hypothetical protein